MKSIAVFCGSNYGFQSIYKEKTSELGAFLAQQNIKTVYGGGSVGLMGTLADAALAENGQVIGVSPQFLIDMEVHHDGLTEMVIVDSMHERKLQMYEWSDAILILPGGCGTLDEFFEIFTWGQLGLHKKPIGILNWNGYYDHLLAHMDKMVKEGFLRQENQDMIQVSDNISEMMNLFDAYDAPDSVKWLAREGV